MSERPHIARTAAAPRTAARAVSCRLLPLAVAVAVAVLALAGCGGSRGGSVTTETVVRTTTSTVTVTQAATPTPTKAEFIAAADKVCKDTNARLDQFEDALRSPDESDAAAADKQGDLYERAYQEELRADERLHALGAPRGDREIIGKLLAAYRQQTALLGLIGGAVTDDDDERTQALSEERDRVTDRAHSLAQGYGFKVCGAG